MAKVKTNFVRKNFAMRESLVERLREEVEDTGFTEAQIFNMAIDQYFKTRDMQNIMAKLKPENFVKEMISYAEDLKSKDPLLENDCNKIIDSAREVLENDLK